MADSTTTNDRGTKPTANLPKVSGGGSNLEYLVKIGGAFYVASRMMGYTDPVERINYYKVTGTRADPYTYFPDLEKLVYVPLHTSGGGFYIASDGRGGKAHLRIDYHAPCEYIDDYPVPCPKVRKGIETRWNGNRGYWEKLLKTGWVPA